MTPKDAFALYEEGKHRRYGLLFSVNGGAFAVANLLKGEPGKAVGDLSLPQLAVGMILFTALMTYDIYAFGRKMRANYLPDVFGREGKFVLILLGFLLCMGWFLAGPRRAWFAWL